MDQAVQREPYGAFSALYSPLMYFPSPPLQTGCFWVLTLQSEV